MSKLVDMLRTSAMADKAKALLSLELLETRSVGTAYHPADDFYKNAEDALSMLVEADDRLTVLDKYFSNAATSKQQING